MVVEKSSVSKSNISESRDTMLAIVLDVIRESPSR